MKYVRTTLLLLTVAICSSLNFRSDTNYIVDVSRESPEILIEKEIPEKPRVAFGYFMAKMALLESNNDYNAINRYGYLGKYQFSTATLRGLKTQGYLDITEGEIVDFRSNPVIQEEAMRALIYHNLDVLERYGVMKYVGKKRGGVTITINGLLAASHLVGPYGAKQFVVTNGKINKADGNGTTAKDYIKIFET